jgi:hypothetical protein
MKGLLISLSGARPEILDKCPTERGKFEGIGGAVLITSGLAMISMWFALSTAVGVNPVLAVVPAVLWGLAILTLDRWLVTSMPADGARRWRFALPRVAMALLLGFVVSTPLVLQIFHTEIDAQITEIKQNRADDFLRTQQNGALGKQITSLRAQVAAQQKVIDSGGDVALDPATDPRVKSLTAERDKAQQDASARYKEWQCQLYGGPNCPRKGDGPLAQASKRAYDTAQATVNDLNDQIDQRKRQLSASDDASKRFRVEQAREALPKLQQQLDTAQRRQADLQRAFDAENKADGGLLIRLQALNEASGQDFTLNSARFLLFLLFLLIECLPVTVKLMQKPGNYERILAIAARREYRDARDSLNPVPGPRDESAGTVRDIWLRGRGGPPSEPAPETPTERRPTSVQEIWGRTGPAAPEPPGDPGPVNGATRYDRPAETDDHLSPDDTALREMDDPDDVLAGDGPETSGRVQLYPENDDY